MSDDIVTLCLPRLQASFLQANLSLLATNTRAAMTRPGLDLERHEALNRRALILELIDDAVRSALLDVPKSTRKSARGVESMARPAVPQGRVIDFHTPWAA